jgi:HK97 family phage portal protein
MDQRSDYSLSYTIRKRDGVGTETLLQDEVFHLRGLSLDGLRGAGVIEYARQTIGLGLAAEQYAARFYSQNAMPSVALMHPAKPNREARQRIRDEYEADTGGLANAHRAVVLAEGIEVKPLGLSHEDSQFLQSRQFEVEEIARWFGVPLHKIQMTSKETSWGSGIEEMNMDFIASALRPWAQAWQQAISRDLILDESQYYAEFLFDAMTVGRLLDRYQAFHLAITDGWMSRNEAREIENHNREDGLDTYLMPANMIPGDGSAEPAQQGQDQPAAPMGPAQPGGASRGPGAVRDGSAEHYRALLREAAERVVRKERAAMTKAAKRCGEDTAAWELAVGEFYADHADFVATVLAVDYHKAQGYCDYARRVLQDQGPYEDEAAFVGREDVLLALAEGE